MATTSRSKLDLRLPSDREIEVTRVFEAPRDLVWRAFTEPDLLAGWWGRGNELIIERMEVERGGHWRYVEHGPDGVHGFEGRYREVTPPDRIVQTFEWDGMPGYVAINTTTFEDLGEGRTKVTTTSLFHTTEERDGMLSSGMETGLAQGYDALDRLLASEVSGAAPGDVLVIERVFDAPREQVWKAWTEPERVMHWWGPKMFTSPECKIDFRVGGTYLFCMRSPEGKDYWSTGVYREIVPLERIVCTDSFADAGGNVVPPEHYGMPADFPRELLVTLTFEDVGGKTKLTLRHSSPLSMAEETGAREGWSGSLDKLEEYLAAG